MNLTIIWGSPTRTTQLAADRLATELADLGVSCYQVDEVSVEEMLTFDVVLIGVSTWEVGELHYGCSGRNGVNAEQEGSQVLIGFVGCGDAVGYHDTFVDAFGIIQDELGLRGVTLIGKWPVDGYRFTNSRSSCDHGTMFLGLPSGEGNESELAEDPFGAWRDQVSSENAKIPTRP